MLTAMFAKQRLRPLIVITGTVRVEGGDTTKSTTNEQRRDTRVVTQERKISPDRRRANVISTKYLRRLRNVEIIHTDFGRLVDPSLLDDVKRLILDATRDVADFNRTAKTCRLTNSLLWETPTSNRRTAIEGWIARRLADKDADVMNLATLLLLEAP